MSFGLVEVITLLLGLSNFGLQPNPRAPTADVALQYAMPDADLVVQFDATSVVPHNFKTLMALKDQPQIKASPELAATVRRVIGDVDGGRGLVKTMTGIDLATDVSDATLFVRIIPGGKPDLLAAVRGKFSVATIDRIAKATSRPAQRIGAGAMVETGATDPAVGVTREGVLLVGPPQPVRDRLAASWRAPARPAGSNLAYAAEVIASRPVLALILTMSKTARDEASRDLDRKPNFLTDIIARHKLATLAVYHDGVGWSWIDTNRAGLDAMAQISDGTMDLMRAGQIAPRGVAKILLAALESYRGVDRNVDELLRRKADVMKIVTSYTGDGNFKVKLDKNPATLRLDARATGKTLSEVVPAGLFVPLAALGYLTARPTPPPPQQNPPLSQPPVHTPPPARGGPPRPAPLPGKRT